MTLLVNLYGGPGTGKSTAAARLFADLKTAGVNAELIQEVAKERAWEGTPIEGLDQFELFAAQMRRVRRLVGKVEVAVTDSPLLLGEFFARWYGHDAIADAVRAGRVVFDSWAKNNGLWQLHVHLIRVKDYNPKGRYETEEQARKMDDAQCLLVQEEYGIPEVVMGSNHAELLRLVTYHRR